ncbi:N-6 DNA methylase [Pseudoduganella sp. R-31]|uniref:N-6 DNA methylase n=1 Tax=Pseudoduganella sp. R-31 TaxID=3404060 RepID=UPI003CE69C27
MSNVVVVPDDKIVDYIDGRFRADKPEERVRQNILKRLVDSLKYPKTRIKVEHGIRLGSAKPRIDIAIFKDGHSGTQESIEVVVECKQESVSPADRTDGVEQMKSYMAACLNCQWGLWTNGRHREVWRKVTGVDGKLAFIEEIDIPPASGPATKGRKRSELDKGIGDVLLYAFKSCHNYIHVTDGFQRETAFFELLKIIFCKISDEKNVPYDLEFYVLASELNTPDGQLACKNRIEKIFNQVKLKFPQFFKKNDSINLNQRSLVRVVSELQNFSLLSTDIDIKGKAYEEIVGSNLKGDRGQFFTPRNMMHMAVSMINPAPNERVLDPACGTGGFIVTAMNQVIKRLEQEFESMQGRPFAEWSVVELHQYHEKVSELVGMYFYGFDITPELVKAAKMNMVMNNDGSGNMLHADSLLPPYMWSAEFRSQLIGAINSSEVDPSQHVNDLVSWQDLAHFDIIVTNPPFGSKIVIKDTSILEQFELGHIWEKPKSKGDSWIKTTRLQGGVPPEQLFVERCIQLLKPGGRMAIVLPDSILGSPGLGYIRQWLLQQTRVIASIDLHQDAFQPHTGVQTSILLLQKKTNEEKQKESNSGLLAPYNVFMAIIDKVGHDKRGNTIYRRDEHGNEILVEVEALVPQEDGTIKVERRKEKVIDDQSIFVPEEFARWKRTEGYQW